MSNAGAPRVAICGINLESNAFSPPASEDDFRRRCHLEGEAILADARGEAPRAAAEITGFLRAMDVTGPWTPVPLVLTGCQPWAAGLLPPPSLKRKSEGP